MNDSTKYALGKGILCGIKILGIGGMIASNYFENRWEFSASLNFGWLNYAIASAIEMSADERRTEQIAKKSLENFVISEKSKCHQNPSQ